LEHLALGVASLIEVPTYNQFETFLHDAEKIEELKMQAEKEVADLVLAASGSKLKSLWIGEKTLLTINRDKDGKVQDLLWDRTQSRLIALDVTGSSYPVHSY
jgi:hypothetical protein